MSEAVMEISNILNYLLDKARISEAELARQISIPRATINRLVSGRTPDPRASTLNAIAQYFNVSVDQLLGKKPLFLDNNYTMLANQHSSIPIINLDKSIHWQKVIEKIQPDTHYDWVMTDPSIDEGKFAIRVNGESMWPQFQTNTILIISPDKTAKNRDFVIAYLRKQNSFVFRQFILEDNYRFLKAINTIFPTIELDDTDNIIGVVIQTRNTYD